MKVVYFLVGRSLVGKAASISDVEFGLHFGENQPVKTAHTPAIQDLLLKKWRAFSSYKQ